MPFREGSTNPSSGKQPAPSTRLESFAMRSPVGWGVVVGLALMLVASIPVWIHSRLLSKRLQDLGTGDPHQIISWWIDGLALAAVAVLAIGGGYVSYRARRASTQRFLNEADALEALSRSEAKLQSASRIAKLGYGEVNLTDGLLSWTPEVYEVHGFKDKSMRITSAEYLDYVLPEDRALLATFLQTLTRPGGAARYEYRFRDPSGRLRWIYSEWVTPLSGPSMPDDAFGIYQDVTERKNAAEKLRSDERLIRSLADVNGLLLRYNREPEVLVEVLRQLGVASECDRVHYIALHPHPRHGGPAATIECEWCNSRVNPVISHPVLTNADLSELKLTDALAIVMAGGEICGPAAVLGKAEAALMQLFEVRSILALPVMVARDCRGILCFHDCGESRLWSNSERSSLRTVANTLGLALKRLETERNLETSRLFFQETLDQQQGLTARYRKVNGQFVHTLFRGRLARKIGYSEEDMVGRPVDDLFPPDRLQERLAFFESAWSGNAVSYETNYNDGRIQVLAQLEPLFENGAVTEIIGSCIEITELKKAADALQKAFEELTESKGRLEEVNSRLEEAIHSANELAKEAQQANTAKSAFLAVMSHEIRTPLNAVLGFAQILQESELDGEQQDHLRTILTSGEALLTLINDILDYSKIEAGKMELEHRPFALRDLLTEIVDMFAARANERNISLAWETDPDTAPVLVGDSARLRQVLTNLVGNAIKFTTGGTISLSVLSASVHGLPPGSPPRHTFHFRVRDTGIGLNQDALTGLFQPFVQADPSVTRKFGGTGLGLAICKSLVQAMGGHIGGENAADGGAVFEFTIEAEIAPQAPGADPSGASYVVPALAASSPGPRTAPERKEKPSEKPLRPEPDRPPLPPGPVALVRNTRVPFRIPGRPATPPSPPAPRISPETTVPAERPATLERILVAEDNVFNQRLIQQALLKMEADAVITSNGIEALEVFERETFRVILLDLRMPEMDGFETARRLRAREAELGRDRALLIALTADAMPESRQKAIESGMDAYLTKPFKFNELRKLISRPALPSL